MATGALLTVEMVARAYRHREPFVISRATIESEDVLELRLTDRDGRNGRAEASGITYEGETVETMRAQIAAIAPQLHDGVRCEDVVRLLPPGGARNAIDVALWDLEAKRTGTSPFARAHVAPNPVASARTIGIRSLDGYAARARECAAYDCIKIRSMRASRSKRSKPFARTRRACA